MLLRSCPRCGSREVMITDECDVFNMIPDDFDGEEIYVAVICKDCRFTGKFSYSEETSAETWNELKRNGSSIVHVNKKTTIIGGK